jgi:hypothetical protein
MKKSIFVAIAFIAATSITGQLFAQESTASKASYDLKKNVKTRVIQTDTGCSITFESSPPSSADGTTGTAALTKKGYDYYQAKSSFSVSASDNSVTEVKSPRDGASGLSTGKRMNKSSSVSSSDASASKSSGSGAGKANFQDISVSKVSMQDFHFTKRCGGKTTKISCDGGECEIPTGDCPNGDCSITADWSWGASQGGSSRCSVDFLLQIEDGVCTRMAINEKGTGGTKGTIKK